MSRLPRPLWVEKRPDTTTAPVRQYILKIGKWITGSITALACISGLLSLWPVLTVDVGSPLDPNDPFSYPFIVSNDAIYPLFSVNISCKFDHGRFETGGSFDRNIVGSTKTISVMSPHQRLTAPCHTGFSMDAPLKSGSVAITVSYYPFLWPIKTFVSRSFRAAMTADKRTIWLPQ